MIATPDAACRMVDQSEILPEHFRAACPRRHAPNSSQRNL